MVLPEISKFRFSVHMIKDDWLPPWLPRISPEILKFRFSVHIVKMIDPSWLPRILPEILKCRFSLHMVKDDWPTLWSYQKFQSLDLVCTLWKMIDPPHGLTRNFKV